MPSVNGLFYLKETDELLLDKIIQFRTADLFSREGFDSGQQLRSEIFDVAGDVETDVWDEDEIFYEVIKEHVIEKLRQNHAVDIGLLDDDHGGTNLVIVVRIDDKYVDLSDSSWLESHGIQLRPAIVRVERSAVIDTIRWALAVQNADVLSRIENSKGGLLAARLIEQLPEFAGYWESGKTTFMYENYTVTPCGTMSLFWRMIDDRLKLGQHKGMGRIFGLLEVLMNDPDNDIGNAVATCCLENLTNLVPKYVSHADFCQWLGPESKKFCRAFGVDCKE